MFHNVKKRLSKNFTETKKTFPSLRQINLEAQLILSAKNVTVLKNNRKKYGFYLGISILLKSYYYYIISFLVKGRVTKVSLLPSVQVWGETFCIKTYNKIVSESFTRWLGHERFGPPPLVSAKSSNRFFFTRWSLRVNTTSWYPHHSTCIYRMTKYHLYVPATSQNFGQNPKQLLRATNKYWKK